MVNLRELYFRTHAAAVLRLPDLAVLSESGKMIHEYGLTVGQRANTDPIPADLATAVFAAAPELERCFCLGSINPYYHFLLDVVPPLVLAVGWKLPLDSVLLGSSPPHMNEVMALLNDRFGRMPNVIHRHEPGLHQVRDALFHRQNTLPVGERKRLLELLLDLQPPPEQPGPGRRLFLGRSAANSRRCLNEAELIASLASRDVEPFTLSGMTIRQQADLLRSADLIVAIHGASLANLVFARAGTPVIEIAPPGVYSFFKDISDALGLPHRVVAGTITGPNPRNLPDRHRDFTVVPAEVSRALDAALA